MRVTHWLAAGLAAITLIAPARAQDDPKALFAARYAELRAAMQARDELAIKALLTPAFRATDIRGEAIDADAMIARLKEIPADPNRKSTTEVLDARITASSAQVRQRYQVTMQRGGRDGASHQMTMITLSDDQWVQSDGRWLLQATVTNDLTVLKDGEEAFHQAN